MTWRSSASRTVRAIWYAMWTGTPLPTWRWRATRPPWKRKECRAPHETHERLHALLRDLRARHPGAELVLHHPITCGGRYLDILSPEESIRSFYDWSTKLLIDWCRSLGARAVIHANYSGSIGCHVISPRTTHAVAEWIAGFNRLGADVLLWENAVSGVMSFQNPDLISGIVAPLGLQMCVDVSHAFISAGGITPNCSYSLQHRRLIPRTTIWWAVRVMSTTLFRWGRAGLTGSRRFP